MFVKHKLTTLWTVMFVPDCTKADAAKYARDSIDAAATAAGIATYEALVSISDGPPAEWQKGTPNKHTNSLAMALWGQGK